eukprot:1923228-Rhodomonas_salina.7
MAYRLSGLRYGHRVACYAAAPRCLVLTGTKVLRLCYAVPGTDACYQATGANPQGGATDVGPRPGSYLPMRLLRHVRTKLTYAAIDAPYEHIPLCCGPMRPLRHVRY